MRSARNRSNSTTPPPPGTADPTRQANDLSRRRDGCASSGHRDVDTEGLSMSHTNIPAGRAGATADADGPGHAPDDAGKPDSPTKLTKPSWKYIARKTMREFSDDQCTDLAAALTYYAVLALFPALLAMVSLLGLFGQAGKDRRTDRRALRHGRRVGRRHHQGTARATDHELLCRDWRWSSASPVPCGPRPGTSGRSAGR